MWKNILMVGLGGALGSILRYTITLATAALKNVPAMVGTFVANIVGCFTIGVVIAACDKESLILLLSVGFCGGFTTFSTFSAQTIAALQSGKYGVAACYILATLIVCFLMTWAGLAVGKKLL